MITDIYIVAQTWKNIVFYTFFIYVTNWDLEIQSSTYLLIL